MKKLRIFIIDESPFFRRWFRKLILSVPGSRVKDCCATFLFLNDAS